MRTKTAILWNYDTQRRKYAWAAMATLIVALLVGAVAAPRVFAGDIKNMVGDNPAQAALTRYVLPSGRLFSLKGNSLAELASTRYLLPSGRLFSLEGYYPAGSALTRYLLPTGSVAALVGSIQRGIDADSERYQAMGLASIERGLEADLARWVALGKSHTGIERGIAADSERYQAMALAGIQRGIEAESERWVAIGLDHLAQAGDDVLAENPELVYARAYRPSQISAEVSLAENPELLLARRFSPAIPYTDVSKFYAERMRVLAHQGSTKTLAENPELVYARAYSPNQISAEVSLAENPELLLSRRFSPAIPYTDVPKFYAERMRILAHQNSLAACEFNPYPTLAENPELMSAAPVQTC